ncbi:MAG: hypothetical protein Q7W45_04120 [Bacteroidota bacterium]|nr:hypothetical protein [Bacteroidota bacterium]MDP3144633.1 hypothetical protein [Bacteroidota bacterium]MDP3556572.1 hypothetical protein [Bacteroidota bacterium]
MGAFTILSDTNSTQSTLKSLFEFLSDFKNFQSILPEDKVENFKFTEEECSFNIKGITPMTIKKVDAKPFEFILFSSEGLAKFNFSLKVIFIGEPNQKGECKIELMGDLNPFIKAMAEKSLIGLTNTMSLKLSQLNLN